MILESQVARPKAVRSQIQPEPERRLQRKCACRGTVGPTGECEECRKKREEGTLQGELAQPAPLNHQHSDVPPILDEVLRSPGERLDAGTRTAMEGHFGHDFSRVRIHHDESAAQFLCDANAVALTHGMHLLFAPELYQPQTLGGLELIGHELAHVVQQSKTGPRRAPIELEAAARRAPLEPHSHPARHQSLGATDGAMVQRQVRPYTGAEGDSLLAEIESAHMNMLTSNQLLSYVYRLHRLLESPIYRGVSSSQRARVDGAIRRLAHEAADRPYREAQNREWLRHQPQVSASRPGEGNPYRSPQQQVEFIRAATALGPFGSLTFAAGMCTGRDPEDALARAQGVDALTTIALAGAGARRSMRGRPAAPAAAAVQSATPQPLLSAATSESDIGIRPTQPATEAEALTLLPHQVPGPQSREPLNRPAQIPRGYHLPEQPAPTPRSPVQQPRHVESPSEAPAERGPGNRPAMPPPPPTVQLTEPQATVPEPTATLPSEEASRTDRPRDHRAGSARPAPRTGQGREEFPDEPTRPRGVHRTREINIREGAAYIRQRDIRFYHASNRAIVRLLEILRDRGTGWGSAAGAFYVTTNSRAPWLSGTGPDLTRTREIFAANRIPWDAEVQALAQQRVLFEVDLTRLPSARGAGDVISDFSSVGPGRSVAEDFHIIDLTGSPLGAMTEIDGATEGGE